MSQSASFGPPYVLNFALQLGAVQLGQVLEDAIEGCGDGLVPLALALFGIVGVIGVRSNGAAFENSFRTSSKSTALTAALSLRRQ